MSNVEMAGHREPDRSAPEIDVLYVDDDPDLAELVATFLERERDAFNVTTATSADEGMSKLAEREFECVISDYEMPGENGLSLLERVRVTEPEIPFVLYTGRGSEEIASRAISAGVDEYLQKQSDTDHYVVLANRVDNLVEKRQVERELTHILDRMTDAFFAVDARWRFTYLNEYALELLNRTRGELIGADLWEEFPEAIGTSFDEQYHEAMETQSTVSFTAPYPPLDRRFEVRAYPSPSGMSVYFSDCTD